MRVWGGCPCVWVCVGTTGFHRRLSSGQLVVPDTTSRRWSGSSGPVRARGHSAQRGTPASAAEEDEDDGVPKPDTMPRARVNAVKRLQKAMRENDETVLAEIEERAQAAVLAKRQSLRDMLAKRGKDYMKQNAESVRHHSPEKIVEKRRAMVCSRVPARGGRGRAWEGSVSGAGRALIPHVGRCC